MAGLGYQLTVEELWNQTSEAIPSRDKKPPATDLQCGVSTAGRTRTGMSNDTVIGF